MNGCRIRFPRLAQIYLGHVPRSILLNDFTGKICDSLHVKYELVTDHSPEIFKRTGKCQAPASLLKMSTSVPFRVLTSHIHTRPSGMPGEDLTCHVSCLLAEKQSSLLRWGNQTNPVLLGLYKHMWSLYNLWVRMSQEGGSQHPLNLTI